MIKNLLRRIRKFFGLLDLKGESNPYPLNSNPEIHVNTSSAYPDAHGNFENQPKKKEDTKPENIAAALYFLDFQEAGDPSINMMIHNKNEEDSHSKLWDNLPDNSEVGPYHHSNDSSSTPYESDSSSNSSNDSNDW